MKLLQKTVIGLLSLLILPAFAADDKSSGDNEWLLAKYDVNGDSVISVSEIEDKRKRMFASMDSDADGDVSFGEYEVLDQKKRAQILKARFDKLDLNQDGRLSGSEYSSYLGSFDRMDRNGDGRVSKREILSEDKKSKAKKPKPDADVCLLWVCLRKNMR
jgi:hypothetical protein